jgi:hypothetical protein
MFAIKLIQIMEKTKILSVADQVKYALDGRTQRWLSFRAEIPESDLSKKMNGVLDFTEDEIKRINEILDCKIKK